ncbi:TPA: hypothetical protein ACGO17_002141 [Streptococcus suis]
MSKNSNIYGIGKGQLLELTREQIFNNPLLMTKEVETLRVYDETAKKYTEEVAGYALWLFAGFGKDLVRVQVEKVSDELLNASESDIASGSVQVDLLEDTYKLYPELDKRYGKSMATIKLSAKAKKAERVVGLYD